MKFIYRLIFFSSIALGFATSNSFGHATGENYVFVEFLEDSINGRFEFKVDELEEKLGINPYSDGEVSVELLKGSEEKARKYILERFSMGVEGGAPYEIVFTKTDFFSVEGGWAQYWFTINSGPVPPLLRINHEMGYENDRFHRGVFVIEEGVWPSEDYKMHIAMVFSKTNSSQVLDTQNPPEVMNPKSMIWQGMLHIWIGIDHILFLLALTLPIVLERQSGKWTPSTSLKSSFLSLLKVVTVFTIAHSVTLLLASLDLVTVSSRLVESVIALSIILVAINSILGRDNRTSLYVILVLGLFHGLGFASVMGELPFRIAEVRNFVLMILGFNFGVEIGQIVILIFVFPLLFLFRKNKYYPIVVLKGGSAVLAIIATYWLIERAFAL